MMSKPDIVWKGLRIENDRRFARRPVERYARIATLAFRSVRIMDVSQSGARLQVAYPKDLPEEFLLVITDTVQRWCKVAWRSQHEAGVSFADAPTGPGTVQLPLRPFGPRPPAATDDQSQHSG